MKAKPKVSIVTSVYNKAQYISRTINSVLEQSFNDWEMIIVDDCSIDDSQKIIKDFALKDKRIKILINELNLGAGLSRNKAIKFSTGKYIAFLDGDDIWAKKKLEIQINLMDENNWQFSHTSYGYISEDDQIIKKTFQVSNHPITYKNLLKRTEISCLTAVYNQHIIGKYYMSNHRRKQDYALWLSILKDGYLSYPINQELAFYRQTPNSNTSKKHKLIIKHILFLMQTQNFNILKSIYYTIYWAINGFFRYYIK